MVVRSLVVVLLGISIYLEGVAFGAGLMVVTHSLDGFSITVHLEGAAFSTGVMVALRCSSTQPFAHEFFQACHRTSLLILRTRKRYSRGKFERGTG